MDLEQAATAFRELVRVVQALRAPQTGCPWDLEQDHRTLRRYLIEEAYEVLDAIQSGEDAPLQEELGDLLLQVVLHAQVADDRQAFSIVQVVRGITEKMIRRHPHVFGSVAVSGSADVVRNWQQIKAAEMATKRSTGAATPLSDLPTELPALLRAQRLGEKAAQAGTDFPSLAGLLGSLRDAFAQLEEEASRGSARPGERLPQEQRVRLEEELGVLLFRLCELARWLGLDAEASLREYGRRFVEQFGEHPQRGCPPATATQPTDARLPP